MTLNRLLVLAALVFALVVAVLGFDWFHVDGDPHIFGWLGLSLAAYMGSRL